MREAVIVSTARTPIGKAFRGAFNATPSPTLAGHAIAHAVKRAGLEGAEVDDVVMGAALQQGVHDACLGQTQCCRSHLGHDMQGLPLRRRSAPQDDTVPGKQLTDIHQIPELSRHHFPDGRAPFRRSSSPGKAL